MTDLERYTALGFDTNPFTIDGKSMPMPSSWVTSPQIMTTDAKRTVSTGRLVAKYLQTVWVTEWTYAYITQEQYDILYNAYILSCDINKNIEHTFTTIDSNTGKLLSYKMYTQNDFKAPLYRVRNGIREYVNVTFTFTGVGGGE